MTKGAPHPVYKPTGRKAKRIARPKDRSAAWPKKKDRNSKGKSR